MNFISGFQPHISQWPSSGVRENTIESALSRIRTNAYHDEFEEVAKDLMELCGSHGCADINFFADGFQLHLFFDSEVQRQSLVALLSSKLTTCSVQQITEEQLIEEEGLFALKLSAQQSIVLVGYDSKSSETFCEGQAVLMYTRMDINKKYLRASSHAEKYGSDVDDIGTCRHLEIIAAQLDKLCGTYGFAEITMHNHAYQLQLNFESESHRQAIADLLSCKFDRFNAPIRFQKNWQLTENNYLYSLKLSTNQSVAIFGKNVALPTSYKEGQELLKDLNSVLIPALPAPPRPIIKEVAQPSICTEKMNIKTPNSNNIPVTKSETVTLVAEDKSKNHDSTSTINYRNILDLLIDKCMTNQVDLNENVFDLYLDRSCAAFSSDLLRTVKPSEVELARPFMHMLERYKALKPYLDNKNSPLHRTLDTLFTTCEGAGFVLLANGFGILLHYAAHHGHFEAVKYVAKAMQESGQQHLLLCRGSIELPSSCGLYDSKGKSALHYAACQGHTDIAKYLVDLCPQLLSEKDFQQKTAAIAANNNGHKDLAMCLLTSFNALRQTKKAPVLQEAKATPEEVKKFDVFYSHIKEYSLMDAKSNSNKLRMAFEGNKEVLKNP
jgi:hypothetical protein